MRRWSVNGYVFTLERGNDQFRGYMPRVSAFFGIIIWMYYDEHNPPHVHAEFQGNWAVVDFNGNTMKGDLHSRTALRLVREWIDLHIQELQEDWELARAGCALKEIEPLR